MPSPPSASGRTIISASGKTCLAPFAALSPASKESRHPLKESIAIKIFILSPHHKCNVY